jgi:hypothetical protein
MSRIALTAIAATLACLTLASTAQAKWVTVGEGLPPAVTIKNPCKNGWEWGWAWAYPNRVVGQPQPPAVAMKEIVVSIGWSSGPPGVVNEADVIHRSQHTIPFGRTILQTMAPYQYFLPYRNGTYDYVEEFVLDFNRWVAPGTKIEIRGLQLPGAAYKFEEDLRQYTVEDCWVVPAIDNG